MTLSYCNCLHIIKDENIEELRELVIIIFVSMKFFLQSSFEIHFIVNDEHKKHKG